MGNMDDTSASIFKKVSALVIWQATVMFGALVVWTMPMTEFLKMCLVITSAVTVFATPVFLVFALK